MIWEGLPPGRLSLCTVPTPPENESEQPRGWRVVESEIVIETPHLRLRRDEIELPGGKRVGNYYVRESRGFTVVFAIVPDGRVVLVRQYKHGIAESMLELPAGAIDPGETPVDCALRELAEETGYVCAPDSLEHAGTFVYDPTSSTTRFHLYLARDVRDTGRQSLDLTEDIAVELATFDDLRRFVRDGSIVVAAHVASIYYVLDRLKRL
jgi:8-oxo-dGTP pyrophosphatase MutT (NUDIX family)